MYGYIYLTTNLINGKQYIGKHKSSTFDKQYKGSGKYLLKAINKYGFDNFSVVILKWCDTLYELNQSEIEYIAKYDAVNSDKFYNLANGGEGNTSKRTQETIDKLKNSLTGRTLSDAHKKHVSQSNKGKRCGHRMSEETKLKISKANKGRIVTEEHKRKIVETRKRNNTYKVSDETRLKQSKSHKNQIPWNKGLTKETDDRVKKGCENFHKTIESRHIVVTSDI